MVQRGPSYIMSTKEGMPRLLKGDATTFLLWSNTLLKLDIHTGLYWEGPLPTDIADRINASFPSNVLKSIHQRTTKSIAEADRCIYLPTLDSRADWYRLPSDLLDGLRKRGFKTTMGDDDSGFFSMAWTKAGGYYLGLCHCAVCCWLLTNLNHVENRRWCKPTRDRWENQIEEW
jgi:hypothetical protein